MRYEGIVYRPPSEANSLIIQLTIGCAKNTCRFCYMYKNKEFQIRPINEVLEDLEMAKKSFHYPIKRIFLADGDALIVKTKDLLKILKRIKELFPQIERASAYGAPKDILDKSIDELKELRNAGLYMIYMGVESGDNRVLSNMEKGVTAEEIIEAGLKLKAARMETSMTLISGLGGRQLLEQHAKESAKVISKIKPEYVAFLTLMVEECTPLYQEIKAGIFPLLTPLEVLKEMQIFLENVDSEGTVFRSNHASNYFSLAGQLNIDKEKLLNELKKCEVRQKFKPEERRLL